MPETFLGAPTPPARDYSPSQVKEKRVLRKGVLVPPPHTHTHTHKKGGAVKADKVGLMEDIHILTIVSILVNIQEHEPVSSTCCV